MSVKDAKIDKLLITMNIDKQMDTMFNQMKAMIASQLPPAATEQQKARYMDMQDKVLDLIKSRMSWEKMRPQYIKLYSDTFSDDEIDGLVAFYESPAGKAMLTKMPVVLSKSMALSQGIVQELMPQIRDYMKEAQTPKSPSQ